MNVINQFKYATWAKNIQPSIMQKMLERSNNPNMISFALGLPDPILFPTEEYTVSINNVANSSNKAFQYSPPIDSLKENVVNLMKSRGVSCNKKEILITSGAQQAISLLSVLLLEEKGTVATSSITYPGFLQIITPFSPKVIGVSISADAGLNEYDLEQVFGSSTNRPAFFYIVSSGNNPLGININNKQKELIATLSRKYEVPVIEDDCYGFLSYEANHPPIKALENDWTFYVGSFSKILSPSFRTGWIVAPEEVISKLSFTKEANDINTVTFGYRVIDDLLCRNILTTHLPILRENYKNKRDLMLKCINEHFPSDAKVYKPDNGFFIWVELPEHINTTLLLDLALNDNIAFVPSEEFACNKVHKTFNGMRLNFSNCSTQQIQEGILRLGKLIARHIASNEVENQVTQYA